MTTTQIVVSALIGWIAFGLGFVWAGYRIGRRRRRVTRWGS